MSRTKKQYNEFQKAFAKWSRDHALDLVGRFVRFRITDYGSLQIVAPSGRVSLEYITKDKSGSYVNYMRYRMKRRGLKEIVRVTPRVEYG